MSTRSYGNPSFSLIPLTALRKIVDFLPLQDRLSLAHVCHGWRSFILGSPNVWKSIVIDSASPFSGEWRQINCFSNNIGSGRFKSRKQRCEYLRVLDRFFVKLANMTDFIENIQIDICLNKKYEYLTPRSPRTSSSFPESTAKSVYRLLMKQKRLVSMIVDFHILPGDFEDNINNLFFNIIAKHQSTLKCLDLSHSGISLRSWARHADLSSAEFPKLKAVGYPFDLRGGIHFESDEEYHFVQEAWEYQATAVKCFDQTLKHVEEIKMYVGPSSRNDCPHPVGVTTEWFSTILGSAIRSGIEKVLSSNLRKIVLDSYDVGILEPGSNPLDSDFLTQSCPKLTHLHFCYDYDHVRYPCNVNDMSFKLNELQTDYIQLMSHFHKNLVSLSCHIDDRLAEAISCHCENLTTLTIADECHDLSNEGMIALSRLSKLQTFHLIIQRFTVAESTVNGIIEFFSASAANLKELTLGLPCSCFNQKKLFEAIIGRCSSTLEKVVFISHQYGFLPPILDASIVLEGIGQVIENTLVLKHLVISVASHHFFEQPSNALVRILLHSVVDLKPLLKTLVFDFRGLEITEKDKMDIIESMPYCQICI